MANGCNCGNGSGSTRVNNPARQSFDQFGRSEPRQNGHRRQSGAEMSALQDLSNYFYEDINVPAEIGVGEPIIASVTIAPTENSTAPFVDPDHCVAQNLSDGTRIDIVAFVDGVEQGRRRFCLPRTRGGASGRTAEFSLPPQAEAGAVNVELVTFGTNSDVELVSVTRTAAVVQEQQCEGDLVYDPDTGQCISPDQVDPGGSDPDDNGDGPGGVLQTCIQNPLGCGAVAVIAGAVANRTIGG